MNGAKVAERAKKYLGQKGGKFCKAYGLNYVTYWCCIFVWYIFKDLKASKLFYGGGKVCNCRVAWNWLRVHCKHVKMADAKPGDIILFTWSGKGYNKCPAGVKIDHIGFIRAKGSTTVAHTIEGNTGASSPAYSTVMNRDRASKYVFGIYRPDYGNSVPEVTPEPAKPKKKKEPVEHKATYQVVTDIGSNIREDHNMNSKRIGGLGKGAKIKTVRKYGDWVEIEGAGGWVCVKGKNGTYLKKIK